MLILVLACCAVATDTIYLPALHSLVKDFNTTETMGAASVALYMFAVGVTALIWGPFSGKPMQQGHLCMPHGLATRAHASYVGYAAAVALLGSLLAAGQHVHVVVGPSLLT